MAPNSQKAKNLTQFIHESGPYSIKNHIRPTQLLNATGIGGGIQDRQALKYQPLVTSRLIFRYSMITNGIK